MFCIMSDHLLVSNTFSTLRIAYFQTTLLLLLTMASPPLALQQCRVFPDMVSLSLKPTCTPQLFVIQLVPNPFSADTIPIRPSF